MEKLCIDNFKKWIFSLVHQSLPSNKAIFKEHILSFGYTPPFYWQTYSYVFRTRLIYFLFDVRWLHQTIRKETTLRAPKQHSKLKMFLVKAYSCLHRQGILTSSIFYLHTCETSFYKERNRDRECKPLQYTAFHIFLNLGKSSWIFKELIRS